jgi:hypothetical protein
VPTGVGFKQKRKRAKNEDDKKNEGGARTFVIFEFACLGKGIQRASGEVVLAFTIPQRKNKTKKNQKKSSKSESEGRDGKRQRKKGAA